ncbi:MAG TPA: hypothetical protein VFN95_03435 [Flavitalea sp.]|nr:hypothetical protein [Flavitalea sp.]
MKIKLLDFKENTEYPSGSGIEYFDGQVYLAGDDAADILIMDKKWRELGRIKIFQNFDDRIPKDVKSDLEATTVVFVNEVPHLLIVGSGSREQHRNKAILVNLQSNNFTDYNIEVFYNRLKDSGIHDLNIESAAVVEDLMILGNRGNRKNEANHIIITQPDFWNHPENAEIRIIPIELEDDFAELSGLTYSEKNDTLLFTASKEDRDNSYDDGKIGESYFGVIENAYRKLYRKKMKVNEQVMLSEIYDEFKGHKVESVCIQSDKTGRLKLHLVADNDKGGSVLFKVLARL